MSFADAINQKAIEIGKLSVEMTTAAGSGHPSTALSLAHLVATLMFHQLRYDPANPEDPRADQLVLSEGHAVPIVYAACAEVGMVAKFDGKMRPMTREDAMTLRAIDSPIDGHPHPQVGFPFFPAATGSLGQGLSVAAGLAWAAKHEKTDKNVYCIIGDGEAREGQIWEACDFLMDYALTNCVPIFNCNQLAQSDWVSPQQSAEVIGDKLASYGFVVREINGHDPDTIKEVFDELHVIKNGNRPMAIVAHTIKGWGARAEQGMGHHGKPVSQDHLKKILGQLEVTAEEIGAHDDGSYELGPAEMTIADKRPKIEGKISAGDPLEGFEAVGIKGSFDKGKLAPRKAYGAALLALAKNSEAIIGLDADVKNSTHAEWLYKAMPQRFAECKIAEQNMIGVGAGLSDAGYIPMISTFAKFFARAYDQIEMAIIGGANLKLTGSHAGVTLASDGPSQMSLADVAYFRSMCHVKNFNGRPAVTYFFPSDAISCYRITELMANLDGSCYQRTVREDLPPLYKATDTDFKERGHRVVREGKKLTFVAAGYMVHECLAAAEKIDATVIDAYTLPLDAEPILAIAEKTNGKLVVVDDCYTGGLDAELAMAIASSGSTVRLQSLYVHQIPKSGRTPDAVLKYLSLDKDAILKAVS